MQNASSPYLSVVIVIVGDTTTQQADTSSLNGCLEALAQQKNAPPIEIIVPHHDYVIDMDQLATEWPQVRFLLVPDARHKYGAKSREHHDILRARGLAAAHGAVVAMIEDVGWPDSDWAAAICTAHQQDFAAVGGAIENGIDSPLNWAVYFCDFGRYQNPLPDGESEYASDANISFKRHDLEAVRDQWQEAFREPMVNGALRARGRRLALASGMVIRQHRKLTMPAALAERAVWGRSYAATRVATMSRLARGIRALLSPILPFVLLVRIGATAHRRKRHFASFLKAAPLILPLLAAWSFGELVGYVKGVA